MYYRGAHAALLLYDITNASTFDDVKGWLEGIHIYCLLPQNLSQHVTRAQKERNQRFDYLYCRIESRPHSIPPSY
jgi:GTPase SAR1 family protein